MKYQVFYQQWAAGAARPSETNSFADRYEMTVEEVAALPQVGDHVNLVDFEGQHELRGVVMSRLFVLGKDFTTVNIVVKDDPNTDWGLLIKE